MKNRELAAIVDPLAVNLAIFSGSVEEVFESLVAGAPDSPLLVLVLVGGLTGFLLGTLRFHGTKPSTRVSDGPACLARSRTKNASRSP